MRRRLTAIALVTVLICMVLTNTIACSPSPEKTYYELILLPRYGGKIVYDYVWGGVEYSDDCQPGSWYIYPNIPEGRVVVLTAVPDEGFVFVNWTGDVDTIADAHDATITITMSRDYVFVAHFIKEIRDWHDLDSIRDNLRADCILMNGLDSTTVGYEELASATANDGKGWQPIGTPDDPFMGSFDGQGFEIGALFIDRPDESDIGLFGRVDRGLIDSLGLVNADVTGESDVGGLLGRNDEGTVSNSYSTGKVTGNSGVGGLVGFAWCLSTVTRSYSACDVSGSRYVGGLVGVNWCGAVDDSYFTGSVKGYDNGVGGLVGINFIAGGTLNNSYSTGSVFGDKAVGGLVGINWSTVTNAYATGNVTGNSRVGGLVGSGEGGTVNNSYASGNVTGTLDVGGLVGSNEGGTVSNSFWDTETSGQDTSAGGTGKTTAHMKDFATFTDTATEGLGEPWEMIAVANPDTRNSDYIWNIVDGETYPFLRWQPVT